MKFIEMLFPSVTIAITDNKCTYLDRPLKHVYLYDLIPTNQIHNYICIHTKLRHDGLIDRFKSEILHELVLFLTSFKTDKTILLVGERNIGKNLETVMHKTMSLYNELLCLKPNNNVVDLTVNELTEGNTNFDHFKSDIETINKSYCNITFGIGGPFLLCSAFSKKHIAFIPFLDNSPYHVNVLCNNICQTVPDFKQLLEHL
jgi:hypothetical protein